MRYSDQPIQRPAEDLLDRAPFSLTLAKAIDSLGMAREGFVIGIIGEWGSGKTSVLRLIGRYLRHLEMERASQYVLPFETQSYPQTIEQLEKLAEPFERAEPYIRELDAAFKNIARARNDARWKVLRSALTSDAEANAADRYWRLKNYIEQNQRTIIINFSPWLISGRAELASALLGDMARALGDQLGDSVRVAFGQLLERLSELAPVVGASLDLTAHGLGSIARAGGSLSKKIADRLTTGPTLDELRKRLIGALAKLRGRQVLVIIDDLDRLTPNEALEMISVVKSLGNLPEVIYILAYEEKKLDALITEAIKVDGHEFVEKIVQYPVHLPILADEKISAMIDADLATILGEITEDEQKRLSMAWFYVLRSYIDTPRDVRRFVNVMTVARAGLADHTDTVDLLILEALRLYEPDVYQYVREHFADLGSQ